MKKKVLILSIFAAVIAAQSCSDVRREPGATYMPDMAYSRAYETYAERDSSIFTTNPLKAGGKIFYNNLPVAGTIARDEEMPFLLTKDGGADTANYIASKQIVNPLPQMNSIDKTEAQRLFLVNCGICHGTKLDGNGPLYKDGNGPFPAKPANFHDAKYVAMPEGQMFYSVTYGKNLMGSYASQLSRKQRWMVIQYIKSEQAADAPKPAAPAKDSTTTAKK